MARLRQYFASRYGSQEATSSEFENIIRYLNSAEFGNQTLAELLSKLFDDDGNVSLGVSFRFDPTTGLEFQQEVDGEWTLIVPAAEIRGLPGLDIGAIEGPLLSNRQTFTATNGQVNFSYNMLAENADLMVWVNGVLLAQDSYTYTEATDTLTLLTAPGAGAVVLVATIRSNPAASYLRIDIESSEGQVLFPFPFVEDDEVIVLKNGILQREGGGYDYVTSIASGVVTMTSAQTAGTIITIIRISNNNINDVAGLMLEDKYCTSDGMIRMDKISIPDDGLTRDKVSGLNAMLAARPAMSVGTMTPEAPNAGDFWVKTSGSLPFLYFYDGIRWVNSSPNGMIPLPMPENVMQFVRLNSSGTALEFADVDFSALIPASAKGNLNGVAPLDSSGLLPSNIIPEFVTRSPISGLRSGAIVNGTFTIGIIEDKYIIDGLTVALATGSATVQLLIGGNMVGSTASVTTTPSRLVITRSAIDGSATPQIVSLAISGATSATDLAYVVGGLLVGS